MGVFDSACDALDCIDDGEGFLAYKESLTGMESGYKGYPWDDFRKIKLELHMICLEGAYPYPIFEDDYEQLRADVLKKVANKPPYDFDRVFTACIKKLWKKRFPTDELLEARTRELEARYSTARKNGAEVPASEGVAQ